MHFPTLVSITFALLGYSANAASFNGHHMRRQASTCSAKEIQLPKLPYEYNALEPVISAQIMQLHHQGHHQAYVDGYNRAEAQMAQAVADGDVLKQVQLMKALNFNSGGFINHNLFFENLAPKGSNDVQLDDTSSLAKAITKDFTNMDGLIAKMTSAMTSVQGSAWVWLAFNGEMNRLEISTSKDQDTLTTMYPIIAIDMWEHAYYLQYLNKRDGYIANIFKVINFTIANKRYEAAQAAQIAATKQASTSTNR